MMRERAIWIQQMRHQVTRHGRTVITAGIKGEMPSFTKKLSESDIQAVTAYLRTL
jgi:mono/diheme cytochrome c family protein